MVTGLRIGSVVWYADADRQRTHRCVIVRIVRREECLVRFSGRWPREIFIEMSTLFETQGDARRALALYALEMR